MIYRRVVAAAAVSVIVVTGLVAMTTPVAAAAAPFTAAAAERSLRMTVGGSLTVRRGQDGVVRQLGTRAGTPIPRANGVPPGEHDASARSFLSSHGALFGLRDPARQLRIQRSTALPGGHHATRFEQLAAGLPVLGGELVVTTDPAGNVASVGGETARTARRTAVSVAAATARATALLVTAKSRRLTADQLAASTPALISYDPSLLGAPGRPGATPVWRVEVRGPAVRELVLVEVERGRVVLHINQAAAADRQVCDFANAEVSDYACNAARQDRVEGQAPIGIADADAAYDNTGATATYYQTRLGVDLTAMIGSVPASGGAKALRVSTRVCLPEPEPCPLGNAFWDGQQTTYGQGYPVAQDVVAHELTHGVTEKTSNLAYLYQSGAINESMSDVFGELVDLTDGVNLPDTVDNWHLGENAPGGVIRSMSDPGAYGQPDRMTSPTYYTAIDSLDDNGGIHTNSGVGNKTAYLIGHGGSFNGQTVTGLGLAKTAVVYYRTLNSLSTGADYADLGATLSSSCRAVIGSAGIVEGDCAQVDKAVVATELARQPVDPAAAAPEAPECTGGQTGQALFTDDMESTVNWSNSGTVAGWSYVDGYATSGTRSLGGYTSESGAAPGASYGLSQSVPLTVPANKASYLRFRHYDQFESGYDGGHVQYSSDGGSTWVDAGGLPADNGYNADVHLGTPTTVFRGFSGQSAGYTSTRINVSSLGGNTVLFRFRVAGDESVRSDWLIDDVSLYECAYRTARADYNGDGRADTAVWRPSTGSWVIPGFADRAFGRSGDVPLAGDFTGDGASDLAVYRPSTGQWHISGLPTVGYGNSTDKPVAADYTGDGRADVAVWRPSNGTWNVRGRPGVAYGVSGDIPVPADFTGDGVADFAVWRPSTGTWYVKGRSAVVFGRSGDRPAVADFTGDGRADIALWRPSTGMWYVRSVTSVVWGVSGDIPVAGDFTGDGRADIAVWRPSNGTWYVRSAFIAAHGQSGDVPLNG